MSVNRINHSHANEAHAIKSVNSQKTPNAANKAESVEGPSSRGQAEPTAKKQQPEAADNNAGREQGRHENTGNDTNGTRVNVFA